MRVTLGRSSGAAGHLFQEIVFWNTGPGACRLAGFPGVSFTDAVGRAVAQPAGRDPAGATPATVTIPPGGTAHATVALPDVSVFGPPGSPPCSSVRAARMRVFPPGFTQSYQLSDAVDVCTTATGRTGVKPVEAGRML